MCECQLQVYQLVLVQTMTDIKCQYDMASSELHFNIMHGQGLQDIELMILSTIKLYIIYHFMYVSLIYTICFLYISKYFRLLMMVILMLKEMLSYFTRSYNNNMIGNIWYQQSKILFSINAQHCHIAKANCMLEPGQSIHNVGIDDLPPCPLSVAPCAMWHTVTSQYSCIILLLVIVL